MAEFHIRPFRGEDAAAVRHLFASSMSEHAPALCLHVLRRPWVLLALGATFGALLATSRSLLLPVLALTLLLALARHLLGCAWRSYIGRCLRTDLRDIGAAYSAAGGRFWVAEADGGVVGAVGVRPEETPGELVLKRMAVRKDYRRLGIATALARTALAFARRRRGCRAVVLRTLMVQRGAPELYERVGFRRHRRYLLPTLYGRLADCTVTVYRYELPGTD